MWGFEPFQGPSRNRPRGWERGEKLSHPSHCNIYWRWEMGTMRPMQTICMGGSQGKYGPWVLFLRCLLCLPVKLLFMRKAWDIGWPTASLILSFSAVTRSNTSCSCAQLGRTRLSDIYIYTHSNDVCVTRAQTSRRPRTLKCNSSVNFIRTWLTCRNHRGHMQSDAWGLRQHCPWEILPACSQQTHKHMHTRQASEANDSELTPRPCTHA